MTSTFDRSGLDPRTRLNGENSELTHQATYC
jgi:hypothetical protein